MDFMKDIRLQRSSQQPLYLQLYRQIKDMIEDGRLKPESKLPAIRELARMLHVNAVTVVNAYNKLEIDGVVFSKTGSGTYVSANAAEMAMREYMAPSDNVVDFASFTPSPQLFPVEHFKALINEVLDRDGGYAFEYQDGRGYPPLRAVLAQYVAENGINGDQDDIQVISGAQQGIDILAKALLSFGDAVVMEAPSYTGAIAAFRSRNAHIIEMPLKNDGMDIDMLEKCLKAYKPRLIYVMTDFHNPTGISYSLQKRQQILDLAESYDTIIVEDDYLSELNFAGQKLPPLKAIDKDERVIYIKSFSKILMPGLRLGFMMLPRRGYIYQKVLDAKHASDISTSGLMQRVLELYLKKGLWYEHMNLIYEEYKRRYEAMLQALRLYMPAEIEYYIPTGGLHLWFTLPEGYSDKELYKYALASDVIFAPGWAFYPSAESSRCFRLSFASVDSQRIYCGIERLGKAAVDYLSGRWRKYNQRYTPLL